MGFRIRADPHRGRRRSTAAALRVIATWLAGASAYASTSCDFAPDRTYPGGSSGAPTAGVVDAGDAGATGDVGAAGGAGAAIDAGGASDAADVGDANDANQTGDPSDAGEAGQGDAASDVGDGSAANDATDAGDPSDAGDISDAGEAGLHADGAEARMDSGVPDSNAGGRDGGCPANLTPCDGGCSAVAIDSRNCGDCGHVCTFPNGLAACVDYQCRLVTCEPGYRDVDRLPENGCECVITNAGLERCDGVDEDCNGVVDDVLGVGKPCTRGTGSCERAGVGVCIGNNVDCSATAGPAGDEVCNGADDDCNGQVDDLTGACGTNTGECEQGTRACRDGREVCLGERQATLDLCNDLDDDCDGTADEDFLDKGETCAVGVGACRATGTQVCKLAGGGTECSAVPNEPTPEVCNTVDDDCNGTVDDAPRVGELCSVGDGGCARYGVYRCEGSAVECSAVPGEPAAESCNGIDDDCNVLIDDIIGACGTDEGECQRGVRACVNGREVCTGERTPLLDVCNDLDDDCDGQADEDFSDKGRECFAGVGACRAAGITVCDENAMATKCSATPASPNPERCNGSDDDCNGTADDVAGVGQPCTVGIGACARQGVGRCSGSVLECSVSAGDPAPELCNGRDDDCNGVVDDAPGVGELCTAGTGGCTRYGINRCEGNAVHCSAMPGTPASETCNGVDDDCNERVDDVVGPCGREEGQCQPGVRACERGREICAGEVGPTLDQCDGLDNDCDGQTDEDFPDKGAVCFTGVGVCRASGVTVCDDGGNGTRCSAVSSSPALETCNGVDDDCNGITDDALGVGELCSRGIGACARQGVARCVGTALQCPVNPGTPVPEVCNGIDDDCDSQIDDISGSCGTDEGECAIGSRSCAEGQEICVGERTPTLERCDGHDNDCDGDVDEDFPQLGSACSSGVGSCRTTGIYVCTGNGTAAQCSAAQGNPRPEICNGLDDDCNSVVDDAPGVGQLCMEGIGGCTRFGIMRCAGAALDCSATPGASAQETCNEVDDDCNGSIDDIAGVCGTDTGECMGGTRACADGREVCAGEQGPTLDICNGLDDDCDGQADEDFPQKNAPCSAGLGVCRRTGAMVCAASGIGTQCSAVAGNPEPFDQCDDLDHDCDGLPRFSIVDGFPNSVCTCSDTTPRPSVKDPECGMGVCTDPECTLANGGQELGIAYTLGECVFPFPFAQCVYRSVSLNEFDADHGGDGILEISLCIPAPPPGKRLNAINVYYGTYPGRKKLTFFTDQEVDQGLAQGCSTRFFRPSDVSCPPEVGLASTCHSGCAGGKWAAKGSECLFDYDNVPLWLTAEGCRSDDVSASVTQVRVRHLTGQACSCVADRDCADLARPICDRSWPISDPRCQPGQRCAGVCTSR